MTAWTISSLASLRALMASFLVQLACCMTMSMWPAVNPSSFNGCPSSSFLSSSLWTWATGAVCLPASFSLNLLAWSWAILELGSSSLSSPNTAYDYSLVVDLRTSGSLMTKMRPSLFLRVTLLIPWSCFMPSLINDFLHFFSPLFNFLFGSSIKEEGY